MNRELFEKKIACGLHRAKLRGITVNPEGWQIIWKNGVYRLQYPNRAYILGMIMEGKYASSNDWSYYSKYAALMLNVDESIIDSFNEGYCGSTRSYIFGSDCSFAFDLGRKFRTYGQRVS